MRIRHAMRRELATVPDEWADAPGPPGVRFEGLGRGPEELAGAFLSAYAPGHPDAIGGWDPVEEEARIMDGRECGPLMTVSRFAVAEDRVVGAILVTYAPGNVLLSPGPLVADLFRHADDRWRGLGAALLRRACAATRADGHPTLDLQVTVGNDPALRLYEAHGFRIVATLSRP